MKHVIDIENWNRKEHFLFFSKFDDPFFGITVNVDCTAIYHESKQKNISFFLLSLHKIMKAINATECFRYRVEDQNIMCYDIVHVSSTIGREDGTFGFGFFPYTSSLNSFVASANEEILAIKAASGLNINQANQRPDVIHFSAVPWIGFTDLKHATSFGTNDCVPKISVGKYFSVDKQILLPISITVNHALMDGYHVGMFLERLNDELKEV